MLPIAVLPEFPMTNKFDSASPSAGMERGLRSRLGLFIAVRTLINVALRMVYPFLGVFQRGLGIDLRLFSLGLSLRSASGIFGPLLASVADRQGRRAGMLLGAALFTLGVSLVVIWPSFPAFLAMLILTIMGNFVFIPSMQAYLGDRVPYERRGTILAITEFSWSLSFIIGIPLVGLVIRLYGWQAPFPVLAIFGLLALVGLANMLPRQAGAVKGAASVWQNLGMVFTHPKALAGLGVAIAISSSNEMISVTFGVWLEQAFQVKIAALAAAAFIIGASELGGEGLASLLVDRLGKMNSFRIGLALNTVAALGLPFLGTRLVGAFVGLFCLYLTWEFCVVSLIPLMTEVLPAARATYMAAFLASIAMGRALADLVALPAFFAIQASPLASGILAVALAAAGANLVAAILSRQVKIAAQPIPTPALPE
jgi:MFS transporter, DHA1 family, inner membrane transport protein